MTAKDKSAAPEAEPAKAKPGKATKAGGARAGAGRKAYEPTDADRKTVETLLGVGVPASQVCAMLNISESTLYRHFEVDIERGRGLANAEVGKTLFKKAMSGDTNALIWWTKSRMGWSEKQQHELSGPGGQPLEAGTPTVIQLVAPHVSKKEEASGS